MHIIIINDDIPDDSRELHVDSWAPPDMLEAEYNYIGLVNDKYFIPQLAQSMTLRMLIQNMAK